jgi:transcription termination factor Rho
MTEENTNLEAVEAQPTAKRRSRKNAAPRTTSKRGPRKPKVSENGINPPTEEVAAPVDPTPSLEVPEPEPVASDPPSAEATPPAMAPPQPPPAPPTYAEGVVEVSGKGFGFLREPRRNFSQSNNDVFVTPEVVRKHALRDGMWIKGETRRGSRGPQLFKLVEIEGRDPESFQNLPVFEELTTISPNKRIRLETTTDRYTTRVMDLMTPIGKGQRGLIVAPPRTGKTTLLQHIADAVVKHHPAGG